MKGTIHLPGDPRPRVVELRVDDDGLRAREADAGTGEWTLPRGTLRLEGGGFEGNMVFCRTPEGLTVACSDPALLEALAAHADERLRGELATVRGQHRGHARARRIGLAFTAAVLLGLLAGALGLLWLAPRVLAEGVDALPIAVDEQLGEAAGSSLEGEGPTIEDPRVTGFVDSIVARLAPHAGAGPRGADGFTFAVRVVRSEVVNAFALPGGQIVVYSALLEEAERPEQVAGVLAHEMAHVTLRHGIRNVAHRAGLLLAVSLLLGDQSGWVELAAEMAVLAQSNDYSRTQEAAADAEGVRMLLAAGIDPGGLAEFFTALAQREGTELSGAMSWLSTHPDHASRIAHVRELSADAPPAPPLEVDWPAVQAAVR